MRLQVYYDRTVRGTAIFKEDRHNVDLDFQHRFPIGGRHDIVWGLGYRLTSDNEGNTFTVSLTPASRTMHLVSAFAQDEIVLMADRLHVTLGSKFEHNDFTGFEIQPGARLLWTPSDRHTVWAAIARAVRTPSRAEDDIRINQQVLPPGTLFPGAPTAVASFFGDRSIGSEKLLAYELGYRMQPTSGLPWTSQRFITCTTTCGASNPGPHFSKRRRSHRTWWSPSSRPTSCMGKPMGLNWQLIGSSPSGGA
jgi:iron complex outermembrane receptor protein